MCASRGRFEHFCADPTWEVRNRMSTNPENSGSLNRTDGKRSARSPDWYGRLQVSGEVLEALKAGKPVRLAGWNREGRYGEFISLRAELERPRESAPTTGSSRPIGGKNDWAKMQQPQQLQTQATLPVGDPGAPFDDEIPF